MVEKLHTLLSQTCVVHENLQAICLVSQEGQFLVIVTTAKEMRWSKNKTFVRILERHLICCQFVHIVLH